MCKRRGLVVLKVVKVATSNSDPEELGRLVDIARSQGYLSIRQAAPLFGRHYLTVRGWAIAGHLQTIEVGSRKVVTLDEIERFRREGNYKGGLTRSPEANGAGGVNSPPVATLGDYGYHDN